MDGISIIALEGIVARYEEASWDFASTHADQVAARWACLCQDKPKLFNGKVLMQHRWELTCGIYKADYSSVDFANFLSWPMLGKPGQPRRNGFAMAALRSADGAFLLGVMGDATAQAGKTYFAGGTPDMTDVTADGQVDLAGSMMRELHEETGLTAAEVTIDPAWTVVLHEHRAAFLRSAIIDLDAVNARELMLSRMALQDEPELADIRIVRSSSDIDDFTTPAFAAAYMRQVFRSADRGKLRQIPKLA